MLFRSGGKSTQIQLLAERLRQLGRNVRILREPGGTPIGEEIRHLLKHSEANRAMTPEAELLLMNASRAQLVREVIRPALARGDIVLSDRFYDSTTAYQGHGRQLDLRLVRSVIEIAVGDTRAWPLYVFAAGLGASRAFASPAFSPMLAAAVTQRALPRTMAMSSVTWQGALIAGPLLGGIFQAAGDVTPYAAAAVAEAAGLILVLVVDRKSTRLNSSH